MSSGEKGGVFTTDVLYKNGDLVIINKGWGHESQECLDPRVITSKLAVDVHIIAPVIVRFISMSS